MFMYTPGRVDHAIVLPWVWRLLGSSLPPTVDITEVSRSFKTPLYRVGEEQAVLPLDCILIV